MKRNIKNAEQGFTLIEVLIAVVLLGIAIAAIVGSNGVFTQSTAAAGQISTAGFLLEQVRELTAILPLVDPNTESYGAEEANLSLYDDVYDFDGATFGPPIDSLRSQLTDFSDYSQQITVQTVSVNNFEQVISDGTSDFIRITVQVYYNNSLITQSSWIRSVD